MDWKRANDRALFYIRFFYMLLLLWFFFSFDVIINVVVIVVVASMSLIHSSLCTGDLFKRWALRAVE